MTTSYTGGQNTLDRNYGSKHVKTSFHIPSLKIQSFPPAPYEKLFKWFVVCAHTRCSCSVAANHSALSRPTLGFESRHEHYLLFCSVSYNIYRTHLYIVVLIAMWSVDIFQYSVPYIGSWTRVQDVMFHSEMGSCVLVWFGSCRRTVS